MLTFSKKFVLTVKQNCDIVTKSGRGGMAELIVPPAQLSKVGGLESPQQHLKRILFSADAYTVGILNYTAIYLSYGLET